MLLASLLARFARSGANFHASLHGPSGNRKSKFISRASVAAACLLAGMLGGSAHAQTAGKDAALSAAGAAPRIRSVATAEEPQGRNQEIMKKVGAAFAQVQSSADAPSFSVQQRAALKALEARAGSAVELRLRSRAGTVRQLKARVLQPATVSTVTTARSFLRNNRELLKIYDPDNECRLASEKEDELGRRHLRFEQEYKGLPVWPAQLIVHLDPAGHVDLMDGAYVPTPYDGAEIPAPAIAKEAAIDKARSIAVDGASGEVAAADLVFYATDEGVAKLAWKINLRMSEHSDWMVIIDALNGDKLAAYDQVMHGGVQGSGLDLGNVQRNISVYQDGSTFYMVNASKPMYDPTSTPPSAAKLRGGIEIYDARHTSENDVTRYFVTSTSATANWLADAVSAAYNLSEVYDYYYERHGRNSIDGNGGSIYGVVRAGSGYKNAFWSDSSQTMFFGDGAPEAKALDIAAHEMTHGVTSHTAKLEYVNQSGALNEALSDMFGEAVEARTRGAADWVHGADLGAPNRSLKDPHSLTFNCGTPHQFPAKMSEFIPATDPLLKGCVNYDNGGVHMNSSIINHMFYLLSDGLSGGGVGIRDAERIFYRALTVHLQPKSQFIDARLAAIASADELFGANSTQSKKTAQAFDAVEIFDTTPTPAPAPIPTIAGADSTLFVYYSSKDSAYRLARQETALGDDQTYGVDLGAGTVAFEKVSVSAGGNIVAFVTANGDMCLMRTDGAALSDGSFRSCAGLPNTFYSLTMSASARWIALVLRDSSGNPDNHVWLMDLTAGTYSTMELKAPGADAGGGLTITHADAMTFDFNKSRLFFDAVTQITAEDGSKVAMWGIYALNLLTGVTQNVVPPTQALSAANPALGNKYNDWLVYDEYDPVKRNAKIILLNLTTNARQVIAQTQQGYGFPVFTGDDSAIIFSDYDANVPSRASLYKITLAGSKSRWLVDGNLAFIYRRGSFLSSGATVVEYYHAGLDNYFVTADPLEQSFVDSGGAGAWTRTGSTFKTGGLNPVCRFYGSTFGPNSHFYTADEGECAGLIENYNPMTKSWKFESYDFATTAPTNGKCASNQTAVYRAYNNGFARGVDSNHRITTNKAAYDQTVQRGWKGEGIVMCAPQ